MSILFSQNLHKNNEIRPQEADFTEVLMTIALVPKMLYFYGKMPEKRVFREGFGEAQRPPTVAIVGTRKPTEYGQKVAYDLAYAAARAGAVVVSGLAYGIDSIAHRAALDAGGVTVAVLGTPIDKIYPRRHLGLAREIAAKGGVVMSEMAPGEEFFAKTTFLRRNRLISGLADVVVVVEAAERSGSLNTAMHALEQGREIFAVPGEVGRPMSEGCNRLIQKSGAQIYTGVEDVLALLFPWRRASSEPDLEGATEEETAILTALAMGENEGEEILKRTGLAVTEFNQVMTMLEIQGRVRALGVNRWVLQ